MVYSNGHTISKNIDTDEETYEVFDTIANLDSNKHHRNRHNRIHQNYERKDISTKALDVSESYIFPEFVTTAYEAANNLNVTRDDNIYNDKRTAIKRNAVRTGSKAREKKHFKNKEKGLWARFTGNHRNTEPNNTAAFMLRPPETPKTTKQDKVQKEKDKNAYGDSLYATVDVNNTTEGMDNVFVTIELIGTELNKLKDLYSGNNLGDKNIPFVSTDFPKTAEIEELLTSIKMKSIETIIENDPGLIEVISNSVTETTYSTSMDKLLPPAGSTPYADYAEGNLFQDIPVKKRPDDPNDEINDIKSDMDSFESHKRTKKMAVRSVTYKCSPLEKFESDVKRIYNKMKSKVYRKTPPNTLIKTSMKEMKDKAQPTKPIKKISDDTSVDFSYLYAASSNATSPMPLKQLNLKANSSEAKHLQRSVKHEKNKLLKNITAEAGYDKTNENNIQSLQSFDLLTMIATTPNTFIKNKQTEDYRSTKRRSMTLRNHERNEGLNGIDKTDFELSDPINLFNASERLRRKAVYTDLSKKISYNDYVNGYKHYLKFQQDLGRDDDNFSPMVKYQAHRHHKVDDIGKFILNKIPQLTTCDDKTRNLQRQKRYFVDKKHIDNKQSIKADSDWINKHILFLLDKHPKKFHTSQIVPLKSPINNVGSERFITKMYKKHQELYSDDSGPESIEVTLDNDLTTKIDLDALSRSLHAFDNRSIDYAVTNIPEPEISRQECKECKDDQMEPPIIHMNNNDQQQIPIRLMRSLQLKQKKSNSSVHSQMANNNKHKIENSTKYTNPVNTLLTPVKPASHREKNLHKKYYRNMHTSTLATIVGRSSNATSRSKFRGLFKKFHLNSRNTEKKYKRAGSTRLDPIKRLKNIFKMGQDRSKADRFQLPDTPQETKTTPEMTDHPSKSTRPSTKSPTNMKHANATETTTSYQSMTNINDSLIHSPFTFKKNTKPSADIDKLSDIDKNIQRLSDLIKKSGKSSPVLNNNQKSSSKNATNKHKSKNKSTTIQCIDISKILQHSESKTEAPTKKNKMTKETSKTNKNAQTTPHKNKMIQFIPNKSLNKTIEEKTNKIKSLLHSPNINANVQTFPTTNKYIEKPTIHKNIEHSPSLNKYKGGHSSNLHRYIEPSTDLNKYNEHSPNINKYNDHSPNINEYNEHLPSINKYNEHTPNLNKYNEHLPNLNKYNEHSPNINKYNEHSPNLNKYNENSPNINKYNEHSPNLNKYNEHSPNLNKYNENSPNINKYNENSPNLNKYNEHSPNLNKYNENSPNINKYNEHSPNLNKYNEHSPSINKYDEHSPNLNKYDEHSPNLNKYKEHLPKINDEHPPDVNNIEKSFDINKYIEQSLGINKNIDHMPDFNKNSDHSSEINKNVENSLETNFNKNTDHSLEINKNVENSLETNLNKNTDHSLEINKNVENPLETNNNFEHFPEIDNDIEHSTNINSNFEHTSDEFKNSEPWINIDRNNKYPSALKKNEPLLKLKNCKDKNINVQMPNISKHVIEKPDSGFNIHKHIQCDSDFLKNIKHLPDYIKNQLSHQNEFDSPDSNTNNNEDSEFLKTIEHALDFNKHIFHGPSKTEEPSPDVHETTEDDAELLQEIEDTLHLTIKNQHGSPPIENPQKTSIFNKFTQSGSELIKAMELVLNINNNICNASEGINKNLILNKNTSGESGIHTKNLQQYINNKVHHLSEAINNNQHAPISINMNNKTLEETEFEKTINKNIHRGTEAMKKTAHEASELLKNVVHTTSSKSNEKKNEYTHSERAPVHVAKHNKNLKNKSKKIKEESDLYGNVQDESYSNKIVKLEAAKDLHKKMTNEPHLHTFFSKQKTINTKSPSNVATKAKSTEALNSYEFNDMKADLGANIRADNFVTNEYISEASDLIEPLPVFPDHTTEKYENFASIFEPNVHDPSALRDMLPFGFHTTKKGLLYKKLKGALHLHQDKSKPFDTELDSMYATEKMSPLLTEKDMYATEKMSPLLTERNMFPTEKGFPRLTEKDYSQEASNGYFTEIYRVNRKESKKKHEPNSKKKNIKKLKGKKSTTVTKPSKKRLETLPDLNLEIARMQNALAKKYGTTAMYNHNPIFTAIMTLMGGQTGESINKIYKRGLTKVDCPELKEAESFSQTKDFETKDTPALMVDSTLLSYDGEVETVTNVVQLNQVKKSDLKGKESTMSSKVKNVMRHKPKVGKIITKAKERPEMYYSTPLPMKPEDFARFLKDQGMDVASVTSPLIDPLPGSFATQHIITTTQVTDRLKTKSQKEKRKRENRRGWFSSEDERVIILNDNAYDEVEEEKPDSDKAKSKEHDEKDTVISDTNYDARFLPTFEPKFDRLNPKVKLEPRCHTNETSLLNSFGSELFNVPYNATEPIKEITDEEISRLEEKFTTKLTPEAYHPDIPTKKKPLNNALLYNRTTEYVMPGSSSKPGTKRPSSTKTNVTTGNLFGDGAEWPQLLNPEEVHISSHRYDVDISFRKHLSKPSESSTPELNYDSTEYNVENERDKNFQELTEKPKYKKDIMKTKRPHSNGIRAAVKMHRKRSYLKTLPHNMKYFPDGIFNKKPEVVENTIKSPVSKQDSTYTTKEMPGRLLRMTPHPWESWRDMIKYKTDPRTAYTQTYMDQQNKDVQYDILDAFKFIVKEEPEFDYCHHKGINHQHIAFDEDREAPRHHYKYYNKDDDDKRFDENVFDINQKPYMSKYHSNKPTELFSLIPHIVYTTTTQKTKTTAATSTQAEVIGSTEVEYIAKQDKGHKTVIVPVSKSIKGLAVTDPMNDEVMSSDENLNVGMDLAKIDTARTTIGEDASIDEKTHDLNVAEMEDDKDNIQFERSLENSLESKNQKLIEIKKTKHNLQAQKSNIHKTPTKSTQTPITSLHKSDTKSKQHTIQKVSNTNMKKNQHFKRDAETQSTGIAKDVAALEVVVDLMKNTGDEEKEIGSVPTGPTYYTLHNDATNAIQLHIVVPCDVEPGLKRSLGLGRIRKIFSAKMSTPVDLEYQVHSVEESPTFELLTTTPVTRGLSPGMYLLLSRPNDGYALKPVRVQNRTSTVTTKENVIDNTARLKLSKDFVEAVSNKIEELFDNLSIVNKSQAEPRKRRQTVSAPITSNRKASNRKKPARLKQLIKKYFGYDNVCNCKCVAGRPMCRDCAASNAVIEELITEFDNIVQYMTDHCTEIQTYFWMNPSGGLKLRDAVDKVSKNLHAYYKRTKGKCKGKPCNSLANHIDKRQFVRTSEDDHNKTNKTFLDALIIAADNFNKTFESILDHNKFEQEEQKMSDISSFMPYQAVTKRSDPKIRKKKIVKNVYSLDSININLICNSDNTSVNPFESTVPLTTLSTENSTTLYSNDLDYKASDSKPTRFKSLFWNNIKINDKDKPFFFKKSFKRDAVQVNASAAAGDSDIIWIDTKPSSNNEYKIVRSMITRLQPEPDITQSYTEPVTVTDYFSQNLNKVLDLFQNLQDVESSVSNLNGSSLSQTSLAMQSEEITLAKPTIQETNENSAAATTYQLTAHTESTTKPTTKPTTKLTSKFNLLKTIKKTFCPTTKPKCFVTTNHTTTVLPHSTLAGKPDNISSTTAKPTVTKAKPTKSVSIASKSNTVSSTDKPAASTRTNSKSSATVSKSKAKITSASKVNTSATIASKATSITTLMQKPSLNIPAISSLRTLLPNTSSNVIETYYIIYPEGDPDSAYPDNLYSDIFLPVSNNSFKRNTGLNQNSLDDIHKQIDAISNEILSMQQNTAIPDQYETKTETYVKQSETKQQQTKSELNQNGSIHSRTETVHRKTNSELHQNESKHMLAETKYKQPKSKLDQKELDHKLAEAEHKQTKSKMNQTEPKQTKTDQKKANSEHNQNGPERKIAEAEVKQTKSEMNQNEPEHKIAEAEVKQTKSEMNQYEPEHKLAEVEVKQNKSDQNQNEPEQKLAEAEDKLTKSGLNQIEPEQKLAEAKDKLTKSGLNQNEPERKLAEAEVKQTKSEMNQNEPEYKITEAEVKQTKSEINQNEPEHKLAEAEVKQTKSDQNQNEPEQKLAEAKDKLTKSALNQNETENKITEIEQKVTEVEHKITEAEHELAESEHNEANTEPSHNESEHNVTEAEHKPAETEHSEANSELNHKEPEHKVTEAEHEVTDAEHKVTEAEHEETDAEHIVTEAEHEVTDVEHKVTEVEHKVTEAKHKLAETEQKLAETEHKLAETEHKLVETEHKLTENKLEQKVTEQVQTTSGLIQAESDLNRTEEELNATDTELRAHSTTRPPLYHIKTTLHPFPKAWHTQSFWVRLNAASMPLNAADMSSVPMKKTSSIKTTHKSAENIAKAHDTVKDLKTSNITQVIIRFPMKSHKTVTKKKQKNTDPFKTTNSAATTPLEYEKELIEEGKVSESINEANKIIDGLLSLKDPTTLGMEDYEEIKNNTGSEPTVAAVNGLDLLNNSLQMNNGSNSDESKKLLLSIIEYEISKLNDEYRNIANADETDNEFKRSVTHTSNAARQSISTIRREANTTEQLEQSETERTGLLNKLFGIKLAKRKAAHSASTCASTNALTTLTAVENKTTATSSRQHTASLSIWTVQQKMSRDQKRKIKNDEARLFCPSRNAVCDLQATFNYAAELRDQVTQKTFEKFVKEVPCHKYKRLKRGFLIHHKTSGLKWNWIRSKRSLARFVKHQNVENCDDQSCSFDKYVKDADGIYRLIDREKRSTGKSLDYKLRDFRPLKIAKDELYVMAGDSVVLECPMEPPHIAYTEYSWEAEPGDLIDYGNVEVNGPTLDIKKVAPRNAGRYSCSVDGIIRKSNMVTVVSLPTVDVVFIPTYKTQRDCTYDDLRAIQQLGREMSKAAGCGDICSIRIDEPVCQRDKVSNKSVIKSTGVLTMAARHLECSVMCRRDLFASLVRLALADIPVMENSKVILSKDNVNETLVPYFVVSKLVTTHTLRKKDSSGHFEYRKSKMLPGRVKPVIICGGGYYLVDHSGICVPCPSKTRSSAGDNTCSPCPPGTSSARGATECHDVLKRPRRYDWWWYPPCGYVVALSILLCACGIFLGLALVIHLVSRASADRMSSTSQDKTYNKRSQMTAACMQSSRGRHVSPSRVILARFFKYSMSSSKGTIVDSQETRFERWKEKNMPPSLPTIDFDLETS